MKTRLTIEKLVYGGDGLARLPADAAGKRLTAFVPFTLPGEEVEAEVPRAKPGFARAELVKVLEPSRDRITPPCPYFGRCGGCQWQHSECSAQVRAKVEILRETFARAKITELPDVNVIAGEPYHYRNRVRLHVDARHGWRAGYLARRSHSVLEIAECPIASPLIEQGIRAVQAAGNAAPEYVTEIELFAGTDDASLLVTAWSEQSPRSAQQDCDRWFAALQRAEMSVRGLVMRHAAQAAPVAAAGEAEVTNTIAGFDLRATSGGFFQANRLLLTPLVDAVVAAVPPAATTVWDLYAGVGLFSIPLAQRGHLVVAVEGAPVSASDLAHNLAGTNAHAIAADVSDFLRRQQAAPECIVLDPPRTGLGVDNAAALAAIGAETIVYLACDPVTLARDLAPLLSASYKLEALTVIDLFPQTFHIETLAVLRR